MDPVEPTHAARWRKLTMCILGASMMTYVQVTAGGAVSIVYVLGMLVDVLAFVSTDTLDKALQAGALGNLADRVKL